MAKLIVAYGPSASGKTTTAEAWKWADPDHRLVIEEGDFRPSTIDNRVKPQLDAGNDVWMNILLNEHATPSIELDGYEVEMRKFQPGLKAQIREAFGDIPPVTRNRTS